MDSHTSRPIPRLAPRFLTVSEQPIFFWEPHPNFPTFFGRYINLLLPVSEPQKRPNFGTKIRVPKLVFLWIFFFHVKTALPLVKAFISWKNVPKTLFYSFFYNLPFCLLVFVFYLLFLFLLVHCFFLILICLDCVGFHPFFVGGGG